MGRLEKKVYAKVGEGVSLNASWQEPWTVDLDPILLSILLLAGFR